MSNKVKILLLYTGGTIGMQKDFETAALKTFNFSKLLQRIPELKQLDCGIETISFENPIDSSNMNPDKWVDIATENKIANASIIEVDQELVIPNLEEQVTQTEEMPTESDAQIASTESQQYTVEKGDSLWKIAVKVYGDGYKWVEIAKENKIITPNIIYSGNILVLPR